MPEVWELFQYWKEFPPTHVILAARYLSREESGGGSGVAPSSSEVGMLNSLARNGPVKSNATLPLPVQAALEQMRIQNG